MKAHRKTTRRISAKDREFERLLRRAAVYFNERAVENSRPKRRVAAA